MHPNHASAHALMNDGDGRNSITTLLSVLDKHSVPATWAMVGHLFLDCCHSNNGVPHKHMYRFKKDWYSFDPCTNIHDAPLFYGKDIVELIQSSPVDHEVGLHSFSHVPFSKCSRKVAEQEVKEGIKLAKEAGINPKSFVFPYNEIGHVDVLKKNQFTIYRGNNAHRWKSSQRLPIQKFYGGIDKIIASPTEPQRVDGLWEIPSSMVFFDPQLPFSLLPRAKIGLARAIRNHKVFHIFLHDHSLLGQPSLAGILDDFLAAVAQKRDAGVLEVMTMESLANHLNRNGGGKNVNFKQDKISA